MLREYKPLQHHRKPYKPDDALYQACVTMFLLQNTSVAHIVRYLYADAVPTLRIFSSVS